MVWHIALREVVEWIRGDEFFVRESLRISLGLRMYELL